MTNQDTSVSITINPSRVPAIALTLAPAVHRHSPCAAIVGGSTPVAANFNYAGVFEPLLDRAVPDGALGDRKILNVDDDKFMHAAIKKLRAANNA